MRLNLRYIYFPFISLIDILNWTKRKTWKPVEIKMGQTLVQTQIPAANILWIFTYVTYGSLVLYTLESVQEHFGGEKLASDSVKLTILRTCSKENTCMEIKSMKLKICS